MKMKKCKVCGEYTLKDKCPYCGGEVRIPRPARFSPEDKYGKYRRILKKQTILRGEKT
ncbi:RNA-binding protein Nop10p [Methanothermus fervidus DSM 2088]|uniref:Ribosome biogenesis protein Nop10 n=1 Tax=Methanothermus fervidus (strain ATCC 43054 / DSM 2088 / JCM 10308 / V24 S) TaxID=523846 RepID=E3GW55_METFV|nr:RNA-protein complex protein Nop10 [Methanothermus fervidus]ADP77820.1 RNA-binding protein Nop10p [Methanothermus fervidus DSM 2088]